MDGWNTFSFPFGARPIFRGEPLVYIHYPTSMYLANSCQFKTRFWIRMRRRTRTSRTAFPKNPTSPPKWNETHCNSSPREVNLGCIPIPINAAIVKISWRIRFRDSEPDLLWLNTLTSAAIQSSIPMSGCLKIRDKKSYSPGKMMSMMFSMFHEFGFPWFLAAGAGRPMGLFLGHQN